MRGKLVNGGTSAHQPSESTKSSDSSSTHNFRGGDCECKQVNKRSVSVDARAFIPNHLQGVDLFNSKSTVEG